MKKIGFKLHDKAHSVRGIGFYAERLLSSMQEVARMHDLKIVPFSQSTTEQFNLVHYPYFDLSINSLPIARDYKTIVTILDTIPLEFPKYYPLGFKGKLNFQLQKLSLRSAEHILTISTYSKQQIIKYFNMSPSKITITVLAADKIFKPLKGPVLKKIKNKYNLPDKFALYVGDINWNKNVLNLVKACELTNTTLVIVGKQASQIPDLLLNLPHGPRDMMRSMLGSTHPQLGHLKELSESFIQNKVITLGFVDSEDLAAIYNLASVYCQPSLLEGFGLPLLEAMACGTPCISSNRPCLPEVGGDAVFYFDPKNVEDIAKKINKVLQGKEISLELSSKGLKQAQYFSWNQTAALTIDTYLKFI